MSRETFVRGGKGTREKSSHKKERGTNRQGGGRNIPYYMSGQQKKVLKYSMGGKSKFPTLKS